MVNAFVFILCLCVLAAADTDACEYVKNTLLLADTAAVRECFNNYTVPDEVVEGAYLQLGFAMTMYPYVDIAKNPPSYPSQEYYGKVDVEKAVEELTDALNQTENIVSNTFRAIAKFVTGFRDGHFYVSVGNTIDSKNMFGRLTYCLPFSWNYLPDGEGAFHIYIFSSQTGRDFNIGDQDHLDELFKSGIFAETVDGKDAFEYFKEYLGKFNDMRSLQGRLHYARMESIDGTSMLQYPPEDDAFNQHAIKFSNGEEYLFNITFINWAAPTAKDVRSTKPKEHRRGADIISEMRIHEILLNHEPELLKDISQNQYALCSIKDNANYISIPSFDCEGDECKTFENEIVTCISEFDKNANPIVVNFPGNLGGSGDLTALLGALLNPSADNEFLQAVRKTEVTKSLTQVGLTFAKKQGDKKCSDFVLEGKKFEAFWDSSEKDDYGNGVIHERTQLLSSFKPSQEDKIEKYRLKKNVRKPTDIIVVTDGVCFSACAIFVRNILEKGGGIVVGVGGYNPGDELFVASQNPSSVLPVSSLSQEFNTLAAESGVRVSSTFCETFPVMRDEGKMIPRDYTLGYIDKHLGVYPVATQLTTEYSNETVEKIIRNSLAVRDEFNEACNPNNKRLLYVTDKCKSSDENAMFVGYQCGDDGKWDKSKCLISSCNYGFHVDFKENKCVPSYCINPVLSSSASPSRSEASPSSAVRNQVFFALFIILAAALLL